MCIDILVAIFTLTRWIRNWAYFVMISAVINSYTLFVITYHVMFCCYADCFRFPSVVQQSQQVFSSVTVEVYESVSIFSCTIVVCVSVNLMFI